MVASMIERMCHFGGGGVWNFKPGQFDMSIHHAITQLVLAQKEPDVVSFYAKLRVNLPLTPLLKVHWAHGIERILNGTHTSACLY